MRYSFEGRCVLEVEAGTEPGRSSKHLHTKFNLEVSRNLNRPQYIGSDDLPTAIGTKALTNVFVQGLIGNLNAAHQKNYWNKEDHLKYIMSELQRGFEAAADTHESTFDNAG